MVDNWKIKNKIKKKIAYYLTKGDKEIKNVSHSDKCKDAIELGSFLPEATILTRNSPIVARNINTN